MLAFLATAILRLIIDGRYGERHTRHVIRVGSALTLLVFAAALVVLLIPQPCAPAASGSRFHICNLSRAYCSRW